MRWKKEKKDLSLCEIGMQMEEQEEINLNDRESQQWRGMPNG